jgi:3-hydroxyanthranilate 3,4-dioxygenase
MGKEFMAFTYELAAKCGPYDEKSVLPKDLDIQLTLSRNDRPQPFHLICEHDSVIVVMSGRGRVEFKGSSVREESYVLGDVIYIPAGTPHRILPSEESIHHRFKLPESKLEGLAWYCDDCGEELHRVVWALADRLPQEGYLSACNDFNADDTLRQCDHCRTEHPKIDLDGYRWEQIASDERIEQAPGGSAD